VLLIHAPWWHKPYDVSKPIVLEDEHAQRILTHSYTHLNLLWGDDGKSFYEIEMMQWQGEKRSAETADQENSTEPVDLTSQSRSPTQNNLRNSAMDPALASRSTCEDVREVTLDVGDLLPEYIYTLGTAEGRPVVLRLSRTHYHPSPSSGGGLLTQSTSSCRMRMIKTETMEW
jgi:hypothetical protein